MKLGERLVVALGIALLIVLALSTNVTASFDWQSREGTVKWAVGLADGTHVYLDAVEISKIRAQQSPAYVVIAECFSQRDKLVALTQPSPELRVGQTVDVEGDLTTTESGDRALTNVTVWGYTDNAGTLLYHGPLIKGLLEPIPWEYKVNLTVASPALQDEAPLQPGEVTTDSSTEVVSCPTIADAKAKDVGTVVLIRCHPVSSGGTGSFILGEDGSTDTLTTNYTGTVSPTARVCVVSGTIDTTDGTNRVLDVDSGPNYNAQESFQGSILTAPQGSVAWVKSWADSHTFATGDIIGKIITRNWTDYLYIEDDTRACGIRVEKTDHGHVKGEVVSVEGTLATNADGERYIAATTITQTGTGELTPLGMNNKWLGGGDFAYIAGPPISGQRGVTDVPGVPSTPASGLNNIGLLVRVWGKVTELDTASPAQWFLISDGSNVQTKVAYHPFAYALNDYVAISGISSCEADTNGDLQRVLRPQPLTCTIKQAQGQNDPTNTSPVNFTVTFSEPVTGFTDADVTLNGVIGASATVTGSDTTYNVAVSLPTAGTIVATVPAGGAQNDSGVWNYAAAYTDNSVLFDNLTPTITNVSITPTYSTGSLTITYTASDTGGSGLNKVKLWQKVGGEYQYKGLDLTPSPCGLTAPEGTYDLALSAVDNAGNESALTTLPQVIVDTTAPSAPSNVVLDSLIYYTGGVHATWSAATDSGSGLKDYVCMLQHKNTSGVYENWLGWITNGSTGQSVTFYTGSYGYNLTFGNYYRLVVAARDNAGNVSQTPSISPEQRAWTSKVAFLYYRTTGAERDRINTFLSDEYTYNSSYLTYTKVTAAITSQAQLDQYNTVFVSMPDVNLNQNEITWLTSFVQGFQKRLVLIGEYGALAGGVSGSNSRINSICSSLGMTARLQTSTSTPTYDSQVSTDFFCPIENTNHYLMYGVSNLGDGACSEIVNDYATGVHVLSRTRNNYSPARPWIVEEDLPTAGSRILVHDTDILNPTYESYGGNWQFIFNLCTTFQR